MEITENWRKDLEAIYRKKHESINSLLIDIKGLLDRMNMRIKTLTSINKRGLTKMKYLLLSVAAVFLFTSPLWGEPETGQKPATMEKKVSDLEKEVASLKKEGVVSEDTRPSRSALPVRPVHLWTIGT